MKAGIYQHYKGPYYLVLGVARHSETGELMVVYVPLYTRPDNINTDVVMAVRPLAMFEEACADGRPRFRKIAEAEGEI